MFKLLTIAVILFAGYRLVRYDTILGPVKKTDELNEQAEEDKFSDYEEIE